MAASREVMGDPQVKFGDSEVLLVHVDSGRIVGCPVTQHSRHLLSRRERKRVVMQGERHQGQELSVIRASEEEAKAAVIVQLMESSMRCYVKKLVVQPKYIQSSLQTSDQYLHSGRL